MPDRLRVLIVTNLFPSNVDPGQAPFNRQQFGPLAARADVEVFGVVPWRFGLGRSKDVVDEEVIDGLQVVHPRYPSIRGLPSLNAALMAAALFPSVAKRRKHIDLILGSYAYPDGVAAVMLGKMLRRPVVVKCHGSDLNRVPNDLAARLQMQRLLPEAKRVVVVSRKLATVAEHLGVAPSRIRLVYNGVDRERFHATDRRAARRLLGLPKDAEVVVYVGLLAVHKGTRDLLAALPKLASIRPGVITVFVGDGPLMSEVSTHLEHGSAEDGRVVVAGRVKHDEVSQWMAAADVVCLPSWNEGLPNVVREAHAIGRPVVATRVGGVPEAISRPELGRLVEPRQPLALAEALAAQLADKERYSPEEISRLAQIPTWRESADLLHAILEEAAGN